jgi:hypothetical protein
MREKQERYLALAEEARTYARTARNSGDHASLLNLAEEYERLAREIDAVETTKDRLRQLSASIPQFPKGLTTG